MTSVLPPSASKIPPRNPRSVSAGISRYQHQIIDRVERFSAARSDSRHHAPGMLEDERRGRNAKMLQKIRGAHQCLDVDHRETELMLNVGLLRILPAFPSALSGVVVPLDVAVPLDEAKEIAAAVLVSLFLQFQKPRRRS